MKRRLALTIAAVTIAVLVLAAPALAAKKPAVTANMSSPDLQTATPNLDMWSLTMWPTGTPWVDDGDPVTFAGHVWYPLKGVRTVKIVEIETEANMQDPDPFTYYYTICGTAKLNKTNHYTCTVTAHEDSSWAPIDPSTGAPAYGDLGMFSVAFYIALYHGRVWYPTGYEGPAGTGYCMSGYRSKATTLAVCCAGTVPNN